MLKCSIQKSAFIIFSLFVISFFSFPIAAGAADDDMEFVFATPPITKLVQPGETARRIDLTMITIDQSGNKITGLGVAGTQKIGSEEGGQTQSWNIFGLKDSDDEMTGIMGGGGFGGEGRLSENGDSLFFFGLNITAMVLNFDTDIMDMTVTSMGLSPQAGLQHHIHMGNSMLTPYVSYNYNWSAYYATTETRIMGQTYTDSTSDSMSYGITTIGLDLMLPGGLSLASMLSTGADDDMTIIKIGYNY